MPTLIAYILTRLYLLSTAQRQVCMCFLFYYCRLCCGLFVVMQVITSLFVLFQWLRNLFLTIMPRIYMNCIKRGQKENSKGNKWYACMVFLFWSQNYTQTLRTKISSIYAWPSVLPIHSSPISPTNQLSLHSDLLKWANNSVFPALTNRKKPQYNLCVAAISCSEASYCLFTNFISPWLRKVRFIVAYLLVCEFMSVRLWSLV